MRDLFLFFMDGQLPRQLPRNPMRGGQPGVGRGNRRFAGRRGHHHPDAGLPVHVEPPLASESGQSRP